MGASDWDDPRNLIPEEFREEFGDSETVADALRRAECRPSTTPDSERRCCPECFSVSISPKVLGMADRPQREDGAWKCAECSNSFHKPLDMNPNATDFEWIETDELPDADERSALQAPFAGRDDETLCELAIALYQPWRDGGPSYRELAPYFPYSRKWIGDQVRAWKDGEHRELVPDPTADPEPITVDDAPAASSEPVATDGGRRRWEAYGG